MRRLAFLLLCASLLPLRAPAQRAPAHAAPATPARRPMRFADLAAMKRVSDPQVSPSGKWVMFSATDVSLEANTRTNHLWVVSMAGGDAHQVTFGDGETNGRFSPDAKYISVDMKNQIYLAGWDEREGKPGPARQLTHVSTGAAGALWSPDAGRLLFTSSVYPACSDTASFAEEDACDEQQDKAADSSPVKAQLFTTLLYRHWNSYTGLKRSHVLAVSVNNGNDVRDLTPHPAVGDAETPTFSLGGPLGYAWSPDSHEIAYVTNLDAVKAASTNNDVFTLRLDEPGAKAVRVSTSPGSDDGPQYSPDGKYLAFRSQARAGYESDRFRLMVLDRADRSLRELMPSFDRWVDEFAWSSTRAGSDTSDALLFTYADNGSNVLASIALPAAKATVITQGEGEIGDVRVEPSSGQVVAVRMSALIPAEIVSIHSGSVENPTRSVTTLSQLSAPVLRQLALAPLEAFVFPGEDGTEVHGFLVKPPNFDPARKYPVKFLIHGGPQGAWGDAWSYRWNPELMAASGYVVVMVNPRGSTGYGQQFIDGVNGDWGGKPYTDLLRGLDYAEQHFPFLDKSRECALGASYGGFMANWMLTHTTRFACIVSHDGMFNPAAAYGTTEELWFNEWEFRQAGDTEPAQPWRYAALPAEQDPFRRWSPLLHIQDAKTPTLVIHGQRDYRLDVSEGLQLFTALQRLGVPSEMLYFPDEGHWVLKPQNSALWNKTVGDWCDRWTHTNAYAGR